MTYLDTLKKLAQAAIDNEPSDHGMLSSVKRQIWQDALDDFHDEAYPERILSMIAVIEAAKAIDYEMFNGMTPSVGSANKLKSTLAALAKLEGK